MPAANQDFLAAAKEIVLGQQAAVAAAPRLGVHYSGMAADLPRVENVEAVAERLEAQAAKAAAFRASPRGVFLSAVKSLEKGGGYAGEAGQLLGIYYRDLADDRHDLNTKSVGSALIILEPIETSDAAKARTALHELLIAERPAWAVAA
jgi:hypothetical protein